uniref:Uncharacterized protein n=1 Tax=Anopheles merus TaxID=30066 RepID=A0A182V361_ANOME
MDDISERLETLRAMNLVPRSSVETSDVWEVLHEDRKELLPPLIEVQQQRRFLKQFLKEHYPRFKKDEE